MPAPIVQSVRALLKENVPYSLRKPGAEDANLPLDCIASGRIEEIDRAGFRIAACGVDAIQR
jgi:hypothetical protein